MKTIRRIALVDPVGDYGIGSYTYELAEGLAQNEVEVDVFTSDNSQIARESLPRHHRIFPVLGSALFKQKNRLIPAGSIKAPTSLPITVPSNPSSPAKQPPRRNKAAMALRDIILGLELSWHLKQGRYDLIWTQWPDVYNRWFWRICKLLSIPVVHTVHNVLPHEESPEDVNRCREIYRKSRVLFVHSNYTRNELIQLAPDLSPRIRLGWHGTYTIYPRLPGRRNSLRDKLQIGDKQVAFLVSGLIRPYKNVDAVMEAFAAINDETSVLVIAGKESGYPDLDTNDPLGRSKRSAHKLGILGRVRFIPEFLNFEQMGELYEACDVLMLAYIKHYGSGVLSLGMTYGIHIIANATGGAEEYLSSYQASTVISNSDSDSIRIAMNTAALEVKNSGGKREQANEEFEWRKIAQKYLQQLQEQI